MNEIMTINSNQLMVKEYEGQRVVTLWDIARLHNKDVKGVRNNFDRNIKYLIEKEDYFLVPRESEFARTLSTSKEVSVQALNASKNIPIFTESGYLMMTKPMQDELSWQVQRQLVKGYFKLQEIKQKVEEEFSDIENNKSQPPILNTMNVVKFIADDLRVSKVSRIKMYRQACENEGIKSNFLPTYTDDEVAKSATELLKKHNINLTAKKFNQLMIQNGLMIEESRGNSRGGTKKYKSLTDEGLKYGINKVSSYGTEKETLPLYHESTFTELVNFLQTVKGVG